MPEPSAIATLGWIARGEMLAAKSYRGDAENFLIANGAPEKALRVVKSPIGAASSVDSDLNDYGISLGAWSDALRTRSVLYRLIADSAVVRVPINTRVGITTVPVTGSVVGEGAAVPTSRLTLTNLLLTPVKVAALMVVTDTLLRDVSAAGESLFNRSLAAAVADAVDTAFLDMIIDTDTTVTASTGSTAVDAKHDLRTALLATNTIGAAKLYWVAAPDVAKRASTLADTAGLDAFPAMSATGGEMANLPALVSSGVPAGSLYLIDASGIAAEGGPVSVKTSRQADVLMETAPTMDATTPTSAQLVSMWQTNSSALRATAFFGAQKLRDDAVAVVTGINWGS